MMIHIIEIKAVRPINIRRLPFSGTVLKMGYEVFHDVVQLFHGLFCYYEFIIHIFHSDPSVRSLRPAICPPLSVFLIVLVLHPARNYTAGTAYFAFWRCRQSAGEPLRFLPPPCGLTKYSALAVWFLTGWNTRSARLKTS